jgi:hypothetical protein
MPAQAAPERHDPLSAPGLASIGRRIHFWRSLSNRFSRNYPSLAELLAADASSHNRLAA